MKLRTVGRKKSTVGCSLRNWSCRAQNRDYHSVPEGEYEYTVMHHGDNEYVYSQINSKVKGRRKLIRFGHILTEVSWWTIHSAVSKKFGSEDHGLAQTRSPAIARRNAWKWFGLGTVLKYGICKRHGQGFDFWRIWVAAGRKRICKRSVLPCPSAVQKEKWIWSNRNRIYMVYTAT